MDSLLLWILGAVGLVGVIALVASYFDDSGVTLEVVAPDDVEAFVKANPHLLPAQDLIAWVARHEDEDVREDLPDVQQAVLEKARANPGKLVFGLYKE